MDTEQVTQQLHKLYPTDDDIAPTDTNFPRWIEEDDTFAPFIPTSITRVIKALRMAQCSSSDIVLDLGCGDGRVCAAASALFGVTRAVGVECDPTVISQARNSWHTLCETLSTTNTETVEFIEQDFRHVEKDPVRGWLDKVTILVVFLSPEFAHVFQDTLVQLFERGVTIVAICFNLDEVSGLTVKQGLDPRGDDDIWVYQKRT
ncbi:S-adenosyl-L-methionine-dependent methyltransferase [Chytriomyces cf. hyalinus JEL632]|nr:S-adenosyl-L-methionine-dependent methyltransferase [Chytriomyces cf. hyalinus JEL632]